MPPAPDAACRTWCPRHAPTAVREPPRPGARSPLPPRSGSCRARQGCRRTQREHLARVQQPVRVEGGLDAALLFQFMLGELERHQVALLNADAMLAGQAAADLDAQFQDFGAKGLGFMETGWVVGVEHD